MLRLPLTFPINKTLQFDKQLINAKSMHLNSKIIYTNRPILGVHRSLSDSNFYHGLEDHTSTENTNFQYWEPNNCLKMHKKKVHGDK